MLISLDSCSQFQFELPTLVCLGITHFRVDCCQKLASLAVISLLDYPEIVELLKSVLYTQNTKQSLHKVVFGIRGLPKFLLISWCLNDTHTLLR